MTQAQRPTAKTFFDWIQPSLAADGLIVIEPWQAEHAQRAEAHFTDRRLRETAVILAALHRDVLDYISQAPVLVLAIAGTSGGDLRVRADRRELAARFIAAAGPCRRLPHIMRAFGLTPPMRKLLGPPLSIFHHRLLAPLATVGETALAQAIPEDEREQRAWLEMLTRLSSRHWARYSSREAFVAWSAANLRTPEARGEAGELGDWAMLSSGRFNPAMSYEQARADSARWHEEQAAARSAMSSLFSASDRQRVIDYSPLPAQIEVDGLSFRALASVGDLEEESQRMHHCVRRYWRFVASGRSRIYSIRRGEQRVATVELQRSYARRSDCGPLQVAQLKGPCNARPADDVALAVRRCLDIINQSVTEAVRAKAAANRAAAAAERKQARRKRAAGGPASDAATLPRSG